MSPPARSVLRAVVARGNAGSRLGIAPPVASEDGSAQEEGVSVNGPGTTLWLALLRHGQSEWNTRNMFTGWVNASLARAGEREG